MKKKEYEIMLKQVNDILKKTDDELTVKERIDAIKLKLQLESIQEYTLE